MRQPGSVLVFPSRFTEGRWEFLLLQRVARPDLSLHAFWQGVTGGLEDDEIPLAAAMRELFEETGFVGAHLRDVGFSYSFPLKQQWRHKYASGAREIVDHVFVATVEGDSRPALSDEHGAYEWCDLGRALAKLEFHEGRVALERCSRFLLDG